MSRLDDAYFARVYADGPDPWGFETEWYEARKYALTLAALPRQRYARAFEPGCASGVLSVQLAARCDALVSLELVPAIAERARSRVPAHVEVRTGAIPEQWPEGTFDLVVLSEVAYYLDADGFAELLARLDASVRPAGHVVAVHWTGATDYPLRGADVHARLDAHPSLRAIAQYTEERFVLSVYERTAA